MGARLTAILWWLWRAWANLLAITAVCALFVYTIALNSAGVGAIFAVDRPAGGPDFERRQIDGRGIVSVLRVPLGGKIAYDIDWRFLEGGCDTYVIATFDRGQMGAEYTRLEQRRRARPRAVGQPGREHVERGLPDGISAGLWHYLVMVEATCPTRRPAPAPFAEFWIEVYDPDGPVVTVEGPVEVKTPVVPAGGMLRLRETFVRHEDVPTEVIEMFISTDPDDTNIVTQRRMAAITAVGRYPDTDVTLQLPAAVHRGRWRLRQTAISTRPNGQQRIDQTLEVPFEVSP